MQLDLTETGNVPDTPNKRRKPHIEVIEDWRNCKCHLLLIAYDRESVLNIHSYG